MVDLKRSLNGAIAGGLAAAVWAAQQPGDKRAFKSEYDDVELLGKLVTRGDGWPVAGLALHMGNGAAFGATHAQLRPLGTSLTPPLFIAGAPFRSHCGSFGWGKSEISLVFMVMISFFCLGGLTSGRLIRRISPGSLMIGAAFSFLGGFAIASFARGLTLILLAFAVLCGFAAGLLYNSVISSTTRYFPQKQAFVSGILMMGFGSGSFLIGKLFQVFTPLDVDGWRISFRVAALVAFAIVLPLSSFFRTCMPQLEKREFL